jgi:hypothetical protein
VLLLVKAQNDLHTQSVGKSLDKIDSALELIREAMVLLPEPPGKGEGE